MSTRLSPALQAHTEDCSQGSGATSQLYISSPTQLQASVKLQGVEEERGETEVHVIVCTTLHHLDYSLLQIVLLLPVLLVSW